MDLVLRSIALVLAALTVVAYAPTVGVGASNGPRVVFADRRIGGFDTHGTLSQAEQIFGHAEKRILRSPYPVCQAVWASVGLRIRFVGLCTEGARFVSALIFGSGWRTTRGLMIGQDIQELRKLYPQAFGPLVSGGLIRWVIFRRGSSTGLAVRIRKGRISAFEVSDVLIRA